MMKNKEETILNRNIFSCMFYKLIIHTDANIRTILENLLHVINSISIKDCLLIYNHCTKLLISLWQYNIYIYTLYIYYTYIHILCTLAILISTVPTVDPSLLP